jgi:hypothetical protein
MDQTARPGAEGPALVAGALGTALLVDTGTVGYHWLPLLLGLTFLAAALASGSRGRHWAPGLVLGAVGLVVGLWFADGRSGDDYTLVPLVVLGLGLGAVLAAALAQWRGLALGPMSVALPVLLFGGLALLDQQAPGPLGGRAWPYAAGIAAWGLVVLVRSRRR